MKSSRSSSVKKATLVSAIEHALTGRLAYTAGERSFSPWFSEVGLGFDGGAGIASVYLHYNRATHTLGSPFLKVAGVNATTETMAPLEVRHSAKSGGVRSVFYACNAWVAEAHGCNGATIDLGGTVAAAKPEIRAAGARGWLVRVQLPTTDKRDPDTHFPLRLAVRAVVGTVAPGNDGVLNARPDARGRLVLAFAVMVLDIDEAGLLETLRAAPRTADAALDSSRNWLSDTLHRLPLPAPDAPEFPVAAKAALSLAMNATQAAGQLRGRIVGFPNRGHYACAFLWDSAFQNLASESMSPRLAPDALLALTDNLRADGMMAHFLCSTWRRPQTSQPPLVGWAATRLVLACRDRKLAATLFDALARNTQWWLTQRGTSDGLIFCRDPMETGWDDTPRLDQGPIIALDMTSYVINQQRACATLAGFLGKKTEATRWRKAADAMGRGLITRCYDAKANLFRDVLLATGEQLALKTPAAFLPLWAGVPLPVAKRRAMIRDWLLNPDYFYGTVPFPSVAYDEAVYQPSKWWRGPSWPSVSYLLLELLAQEGMHAERAAARDRFLDLWLRDGELRELFDSQTGEGLGSYELGWTAAIFLKLLAEKI